MRDKDLIERILTRAKKRLSYSYGSSFFSNNRGEGYDFLELIPYTGTMDAKRIFWNSMAKGFDISAKVYHQQKEIPIVVVALLGGSLCFGEPVRKLERVLENMAFISFLALKSGNSSSMFTVSFNEKISLRSTKSFAKVENFLRRSAKIDPIYTKFDENSALESILGSLKKKSLVFIIGDFLQEPDIKVFSKKDLLYAVVVRDDFEKKPKALGQKLLRDPSGTQETDFLFDEKAAGYYASKYEAYDRKLKRIFQKCGVLYRFV